MPEGATLGVLLCAALAVGLAIGTLIGAIFLRAAVALYNKMVGGASSPRGVPEPAFGKAMWIILATFMGQIIVGWLIAASINPGPVVGAGGKGVDVVALISFPVGLLIMAAVLSSKLPTTFGRAILVTLCYLLVELLVVAILVGIAVVVFAVLW